MIDEVSLDDSSLEYLLPPSYPFQNIIDRIWAIVCEIKPLFLENLNKGLQLIGRDLCICNTSFNRQWSENNEGLYLLIHGLLGQPLIWNYHYEKIRALHPNAEVRSPAVPWAGNCSLEEASKPFLELVLDYVDKNPGKPICLIGFSNGARIASYIEVLLRDRATNILVSSVSGVYRGTLLIDQLVRSGLASFFLSESVIEELQYDSEASQKLLQKINTTPLNVSSQRVYHFYTSTNDTAIIPYHSALPVISHPCLQEGKRYQVLSGYGHNGLIEEVSDEQVQQCVEWQKNNRQQPD